MDRNFEALRAQYPLLSRKTYLNSGSYCALHNNVKAAFEAYMEDRLLVGANWDVWVMKNEAVREGVATLLGVTPDEIAVTASASAGLNALASALDFTGPRNKVVVSDFEFPTSAQIWHAQAPRGAKVVHAPPAEDGYIPLEHFEKIIDEQTQIVAITHVCFRNGAKLDVAGVAKLAHAKGAKILLDCYQSVGSEPVDVRKFDVDFAIGGMLKYLLGTAGIGFLYVRGELIPNLVPTNSGWFAQADITAMDITANRPSPSARRFEAGTPAVVNCYASEAGLNVLNAIGPEAIGKRVQGLTRRCLEGLKDIGWTAVTPDDDGRRGPMIAIRSNDAGALAARMMEADIVASHRNDNLRVGFHYYNNEDDVDAFIAAMAANKAQYHWR
ncbi:MAG TPA: aminotransferase class V-fold PLP-dependent enzyme [Caulobacteraceae bacterium]|jgi:selenocysteine lyase/cysteine desulfurase